MNSPLSRRTVLGLPVGAAALFGLSRWPSELLASETAETAKTGNGTQAVAPKFDAFPSVDPQRVYDTVLYAHSDLDKVKALVEASPSLANATMDWGFGDWETAIGAASHMGRRDIAEVLLAHGARPDLFTHAMLGNLEAVQAMIDASPGIQTAKGPHGITLMAHAKAGGEEAKAVVSYLEELGGADPQLDLQPIPGDGAAYVGTYSWGDGAPILTISVRDQFLGLKIGEGFAKGFGYRGDHRFFSTAAPSVELRFEISGDRAVSFAIHDPDVVMKAIRVPG